MTMQSIVRATLSLAIAGILAGCGGGARDSTLPSVSPGRPDTAQAIVSGTSSVNIREFQTNARGVTGGIAFGYDGGVWFTQNNLYVGRFKAPDGPITPSTSVAITQPPYTASVQFAILTATQTGVYAGIQLFWDGSFQVPNELVKVSYSHSVTGTSAVQWAVPQGSINAVTTGSGHVYATGWYEDATVSCIHCLFVISDSGQDLALTTSYDAGEAIAYAGNQLYVAALEGGGAGGERLYQIDPLSMHAHVLRTLPAPSIVLGMTTGSDNAVWFTDAGRNAIGRLTASGTLREFHLPTLRSGPSRIVAGADGALWFTERYGNKIGRITTSGAIAEYALPTAHALPVGIASSLPGFSPRTLYVAEIGSNKLARVLY